MKQIFKINLLVLVLVLCCSSCNHAEEIVINDFKTFEIKDIIKKESYTGLVFLVEKDSLLYAIIHKNEFDNFEEITQDLQIKQKVKVKGVIYKHDDERLFETPKSASSSILIINEIEN